MLSRQGQATGYGEGPNENSLVRLADGKTLMAVVRYGAGDGGLTMDPPVDCGKYIERCYTSYRSFFSTDEGRSWSGPTLMEGVGTCRPVRNADSIPTTVCARCHCLASMPLPLSLTPRSNLCFAATADARQR